MTALIFLVGALCFSTVLGSTGVPVLIWKDVVVPTVFKPALAGHTLTAKQFESRYLEDAFHSEAKNVVVFIQNKLSLEDFTKYGNVYGDSDSDVFTNVKKFMLQPSSISLPAVQNPLANLDFWVDHFDGAVTKINSAAEAADLQLVPGKRNLVLVSLPDSEGSHKDMLSANDKIIGQVTSKVGKDFVAMYTSSHSSDMYVAPVDEFSGRHLLASFDVDESNYTLINRTNSSCPLMYFTDMKLVYREVDPNTRALLRSCTIQLPHTIEDKDIICNGTATRSHMEMTYNMANVTATLVWDFAVGLQFWTTALNISIVGHCPGNNSNIKIDIKESMVELPFEGPQDFSYHCNDPDKIMSTRTGNPKVDLILKDFQIQPFMVKDSKFGRPNECIGFFSIPILMGLTVSLILLSILIFAMCMITDIKTNDQFDDPKGKTITVDVKE